jgi:hypothetical protein
MDEIIGYCGLNCCTCPIYVAAREKDDEKRHKMRVEIAEQIRSIMVRSTSRSRSPIVTDARLKTADCSQGV